MSPGEVITLSILTTLATMYVLGLVQSIADHDEPDDDEI